MHRKHDFVRSRSRRRRSLSSSRRPATGCTQSSQMQDAQPNTCSRQEPKKVFELQAKAWYWLHRARRYNMHSRKHALVRSRRRRSLSSSRRPATGCTQSSQMQDAQPNTCSRQEPKKKVFELEAKVWYGMHAELADTRCSAENMLSSGAEAEEEGLRARSEGLVWVAHRARRYKMHSRKHALLRRRSSRSKGRRLWVHADIRHTSGNMTRSGSFRPDCGWAPHRGLV